MKLPDIAWGGNSPISKGFFIRFLKNKKVPLYNYGKLP
jgi:hypothetical protein